MRTVEHIRLPDVAAGTSRTLTVWRWGDENARPKAYLQASLHADEIPGMLVANHLARLLDDASSLGQVPGQVVLVPVANPVGLAQRLNGALLGRFDMHGRTNFNRGFAALGDLVAERIEGRLGAGAQRNVKVVREALVDAAQIDLQAARDRQDETAALRATLMRLAVDADIVLDLHCDTESELHIFLGTPLWPDAADLPRALGSRFNFLAEDSGGSSFDEAVAGPWWVLARRFPKEALPPACLSATVELRGQSDVDDAQAAADSAALMRFLAGRGVVDQGAVAAPAAPSFEPEAVPLEAVDLVVAAGPGIVVFRCALGDAVRAGDVVAELLDPLEADPAHARRDLVAGTDGIVFTRCVDRYVRAGETVAKIAGREPLAYRHQGALLED